MDQGKSIRFATLEEDQQTFLEPLGCLLKDNDVRNKASITNAIPVYMVDKEANVFYLIDDYYLAAGKLSEFEASEASKLGLYRGGTSIFVMTKEGYVLLYDTRYQWYRPFGGVARFSECFSLCWKAERELWEELRPIVVCDGVEKMLVPHSRTANEKIFDGIFLSKLDWKESIHVTERPKVDGYVVVDANSCIETVATIDLAGYDISYIVAVENDLSIIGLTLPPVFTVGAVDLESVLGPNEIYYGSVVGITGMYIPRKGHMSFQRPVLGEKFHPAVHWLYGRDELL